jgi:hypothetical protein
MTAAPLSGGVLLLQENESIGGIGMGDKDFLNKQLEWLEQQEKEHFFTEEERRALEELRETIEFDCE